MSHFNQQAAEWDNAGKIETMSILAQKTLLILNLSNPIDIMDFGCGTGLFGLEFSDFAKTLVGVDTSTGMLEVFDKKTQGHDHIRSKLIDLEKVNFNEKFDLIISSMAFHHLDDPKKMISKLSSMLNLGGRLAIVDLDEEDGTFHSDPSGMGVKHFGFSKEVLQGWAAKTRMSFDYRLINKIEKNEKSYNQFLVILSLTN